MHSICTESKRKADTGSEGQLQCECIGSECNRLGESVHQQPHRHARNGLAEWIQDHTRYPFKGYLKENSCHHRALYPTWARLHLCGLPEGLLVMLSLILMTEGMPKMPSRNLMNL